jgi:hypothetical protein
MRALVLGILILTSWGWACAQASIQQIDFKNFTYPLSGPTLTHDQLKWPDPSKAGNLKLINGRHIAEPLEFTLKFVKFVDVTGHGNNDAIVVIHLDTGDTQEADYVYIYGFDAGKPKLLAYCYTSGRGYSGLSRVYGKGGELIFELFDPAKEREEDGFMRYVRMRYEWRNGRFEAIGTRKLAVREIPIQ